MRNMNKFMKTAICLLLLLAFPMTAFADELPPMPVADTVPFALSQNGSYYMAELHTDTLMYTKNEHKKMYPASLTKIMTAILTLEHCSDLSQTVTYTQEAYDWVEAQFEAAGGNVSSAGLHLGEEMTIKDLLYGCLISSGNDAAEILAFHVGGTNAAFYDMMNEKAKALGAMNTNFCNANGLFDENHYTTAYDMYLIAKYAMQNDTFAEIVSTKTYHSSPTNMNPNGYTWKTTVFLMDPLSEYFYSNDIKGVKTGTLLAAGRCLVTVLEKEIEHGEHAQYMLVLMGADIYGNRVDFAETKAFYNWALENYTVHEFYEEGAVVQDVDIRFAKSKQDSLALVAEEAAYGFFPYQRGAGFTVHDISYDFTIDEELLNKKGGINAPVTEGQVIGTLKIMNGAEELDCINLLASETVERNTLKWLFFTVIESIVFKLLVVLAVVVLAIRTVNKIRYRRRYGRLRF